MYLGEETDTTSRKFLCIYIERQTKDRDTEMFVSEIPDLLVLCVSTLILVLQCEQEQHFFSTTDQKKLSFDFIRLSTLLFLCDVVNGDKNRLPRMNVCCHGQ